MENFILFEENDGSNSIHLERPHVINEDDEVVIVAMISVEPNFCILMNWLEI